MSRAPHAATARPSTSRRSPRSASSSASVMFAGIVRFLATGWIEQMYGEPTLVLHVSRASTGSSRGRSRGMYVHYGVLALLALAIALGAWHRDRVRAVHARLRVHAADRRHELPQPPLPRRPARRAARAAAGERGVVDRCAAATRAARATTVPAWMVWLCGFRSASSTCSPGSRRRRRTGCSTASRSTSGSRRAPRRRSSARWFDEPSVALAMSWAGFLFDTTIVVWLSWRRTRLPAYVALIVFHGAHRLLVQHRHVPADHDERGADLLLAVVAAPRCSRARSSRRAGTDRERAARAAVARARRVAIAIYVVVQLALPLRHLVYPGDVLWNEDGMRFAWHVMIREKHGSVTFVARFADGKRLEVPPSNYLTWRQEREMGGQPDLILQLARHIGRDLRARGYRDVRAARGHARSRSTAARRPPMIDPDGRSARRSATSGRATGCCRRRTTADCNQSSATA